MSVQTRPGLGTTFRIHLPRMAGGATGVGASPETHSIVGGNGCVLLVEDDQLVREMTKTALETMGYTALVAASPVEAISMCSKRSSEIRLMLTDVVMPGMNGLELRQRVLEICPEIKVLFMSGYTSSVITTHGVLKRGVQFIQKPFTPEDLARRLEEVLKAG